MRRRSLLRLAALAPLAGLSVRVGASVGRGIPRSRVRPGDPGWPSEAKWAQLKQEVRGRLLRPISPFARCSDGHVDCGLTLRQLKNPYFIGDQPALTQASGWVDAWSCEPSVYAVAAETTADVAAAVNFARIHNLRLVVRGGGHGYQGTSSAPDSLLIWTRRMNSITLHDDFVPQGCNGEQQPQPAVSVGAGAMWADAYEMVTTRGRRYVQGGGCRTVGVAGLVQGGGFGSWSKRYGTAAAGLLEAEIVTADGVARVVNECLHPDLFWAIKGGGGGTFGVVTRFTLRTRELPQYFGAVDAQIESSSEAAHRALIAKAIDFYRRALFNPHWGEKMTFRISNSLNIGMLFQGLTLSQARTTWAPFFDWVRTTPHYSFTREPRILALPAERFWDAEYLQQQVPDAVIKDDRPGALPYHAFWTTNQGEAGQLIYAYRSAWLPALLLEPDGQAALVDAIFASSRRWGLEFHFNKGLAGAPPEEIAAARNTATNPQVLDAFALVIIGDSGPPAYHGMPGPEPDMAQARTAAAQVAQAMDVLLRVAPGAGAYVNESDYFQRDWQRAFWGTNYSKLLAVKRRYDPPSLFFEHHGVGSENWSPDGFTHLGQTANPNLSPAR
jgi:FAD/FMN-containing dehydrogenase